MWTATTQGFFSAVQHRDDASLLVVRTRDYGDADRLRAWYEKWVSDLNLLADTPEPVQALPEPMVISYEVSDYPWRVIVPRSAWGAFLAESVEDLDYGNFKDAVKAQQGPDRARVYMGVWEALLGLQWIDPMSTRTQPTWDHEGWDEYDRWEVAQALGDHPEDDPQDDPFAWDVTPQQVTAYLQAQDDREKGL